MSMQTDYDFMAGRDVSTSFSDPAHNSEIDFIDFIVADREAQRVKAKMISLINGSFELEAAIPSEKEVNEETGEVTILTPAVPAVYYNATTKIDMISQISSELNEENLLDELMGVMTWDEYKSSLNQ